jgi:ABC-2 type transport system ATP-binding protein
MIVIEGLNYRYKNAQTNSLNSINLTIPKGALFGLLGPNGAGKTTLISILVGLISVDSGLISIDGHDLKKASKKIKNLQGYIPQDYAFYPNLTAEENLQFFAGIQKLSGDEKQQRIDYCLEFCQLETFKKQKTSTFSGGLKRRLNLAIGLLNDPDIIYLDEPTVGIDPQSRAFILDKIKALNTAGKTIIYASHYMEEIEQLCDQIAILDVGKVLKKGALSELSSQKSMGVRVRLKEKLTDEQKAALSIIFEFECINNELVFDHVVTLPQLKVLVEQLDKMNISPAKIQYGQRSLEQLFLDLTDRKLRD